MNLRTAVTLLPIPAARDWKSGASNLLDTNSRPLNEVVVNLLPTPKASDGPHGGPNQRDSAGNYYLPGQAVRLDGRWVATNGTDYGPAIRRWEQVLGCPAPCPTEPGVKDNRRLSPAFSEWMMGLQPGHVTGTVTDRSDALHVIGNGVVPQQAEEAFRFLLDDSNWREPMSTDSEAPAKSLVEKPRGKCTGCAFSYQLGTARSGEHKGKLVIRKHTSRTGPGLCPGAQQPPRAEELEEWQHCTDTECKQCCGCSDRCTVDPCGQPDNFHAQPDPGAAATPAIVTDGEPLPDTEQSRANGILVIPSGLVQPPAMTPVPDPWTSPAPVSNIPDQPVSMQPEPDRDRWGRYLIGGAPHTRVTTFVKAPSSTYALEEWAGRMITRGLTLRPDLLALAHGLDVKRDRTTLNSIAAQAKEAAGQKVAANLGSAYHAFTERLDAGLMTLDEVPAEYRPRVAQYADAVRRAGLVTQTEWIERTTGVRADQVSAALPVAGMLDRIFRMPSGELVIGDLKTGSSLEYGRKEIESQLAVYAHGVNTHGLYDWNTKTWQRLDAPVRTDYGIVIHLPADGDGCELLAIDLERGWRRAQLCGQVMADQKEKVSWLAMDLDTQPAPPPVPVQQPLDQALSLFRAASSRGQLERLMSHVKESGMFTASEVGQLGGVAAQRWDQLTV